MDVQFITSVALITPKPAGCAWTHSGCPSRRRLTGTCTANRQ